MIPFPLTTLLGTKTMSNNNNQSTNNSNNNLNITNEETMNYLTTLQSLLTQLKEEKATNERLNNILKANKNFEATVISNDAFIKHNIEEFEALLIGYQEENKELQQQLENEGDLSSTVETQEKAIALIEKLKGMFPMLTEEEEIADSTPALKAIEDCQTANQRLIDALDDGTKNIEELKARIAKCTKEEVVEEPIKLYAVGSEEGWLDVIGFERPTDADDVINKTYNGKHFHKVLPEYLVSLDEKEYALFFELNADILDNEISAWLDFLVISERKKIAKAADPTIANPTPSNLKKPVSGKPYAVSSEQGWLEVIGYACPTDTQNFFNKLDHSKPDVQNQFTKDLANYIYSLSNKELDLFFEENKDIIDSNVHDGLFELLVVKREQTGILEETKEFIFERTNIVDSLNDAFYNSESEESEDSTEE